MTHGRLRRAFVLIDPNHGVKKSDEVLLQSLRKSAIPHQVILSKVDRILFGTTKTLSEEKLQRNMAVLRQVFEEVRAKIQPGNSDGPEALGEIIACCADHKLHKGTKVGLNQVRWAALAATGLGDQKRRLSPSEIVDGHEERIFEQTALDRDLNEQENWNRLMEQE